MVDSKTLYVSLRWGITAALEATSVFIKEGQANATLIFILKMTTQI